MVNNYKKGLHDIADQIYYSLQTVLEFMDKGVKGLVTGDLSVFIIQKIQVSIEKFKD